MKIQISKAVFQAIPELKKFDIKERSFDYSSTTDINLNEWSATELKDLAGLFEKNIDVRGSKTHLRDIMLWLDVSANKGKAGTAIGRTLQHTYKLLIEYLKETPHQHLYQHINEGEHGIVLCYYVCHIAYEPPRKSKDEGYKPPYITVKLVYEEFGQFHSTSITIDHTNTGLSCYEILRQMGYSIETSMLRDDYETYLERYTVIKDLLGVQFNAVGLADDQGIDGNVQKRNSSEWWYSSRRSHVRLDRNGVPSKVVIDLFSEGERDSSRNHVRDFDRSGYFWTSGDGTENRTKEDVDLEYPDEGEVKKEAYVPEIPIHPYVACFDLSSHKRLRIHVGNLSRYVYDKSIRENLVLPPNMSKLIDTLLATRSSTFFDVVKGKSGGTIILCQGAPGTGKTLTAEIYAEHLGRPLYTVQCSQLGVDLEDLESNLMKVLARGRRWGAVMLLDEADVYVTARGTDLVQNAIVGVFLRVLEYHAGVLFFTTNRGDLVDDAILSRATARVVYTRPTEEDQIKIWTNLAKANKVDITPEEIEDIVANHSNFSGRDIKNLLKLAILVSHDTGARINSDLIEEIKIFKPTVGE